MSLKTYRKKRNFGQTSEPEKGTAPEKGPLKFVVQRHKATRLHYDFRLEMEGVLKSWAVPKGPSMNPGDKRLAMMVEDHPYAYRKFSGVIPEGNYGAGIVEIWDEGTYQCLGIAGRKEGEAALLNDLKKGSLKIVLKGKKLKGEFALVKMHTADSDNAWLLLKHDDAMAVHTPYDSETLTPENSPINKALKKKPRRNSVPDIPAEESEQELSIGRKKLVLTNLDKIYWPDRNITKGALILYYSRIHKYILPYLKHRPQSLHRTPDGIGDKGFYQKDMSGDLPSWLKTVPLYSESAEKEINYVVCNDQATLTYLNNLGCIELNPWNSRLKSIDKPDYMVMDIDPSENNTFDQVIETALAIKSVLDKAGAPSFCKTSGASGLHVYVPLNARFDYELVRNFAYIIATLTQQLLPDFTTLERALKKRGKDQIYIDYLQNKKGQTLASVYSARPVPGATVSAPLEWKEVRKGLTPAQFTVDNMLKRLEKKGDLFQPVLGKGVDIRRCLRLLE